MSCEAQDSVEGVQRALPLDRHEQVVGTLAGRAVQRPGQGGQPGQQGVVQISPRRRRDAHRHGGRGQLVIGHEDEGAVQRGGPLPALATGQAVGQAQGDGPALRSDRRGRAGSRPAALR